MLCRRFIRTGYMWSSGFRDEDSSSQGVFYSTSKEGINWSRPRVLASDPDGPAGPIRRTAGGWSTEDGNLTAYFSNFDAKETGTKWASTLVLEAMSYRKGIGWSKPRTILRDFMINDAPRPLKSGRLFMSGEDHQGNPRLVWSDDSSGFGKWSDAQLPPITLPIQPNEPSWFQKDSGDITVFFRDDNCSQAIYTAIGSSDTMQFSRPERVHIPDARSKSCAGRLSSGAFFLVHNPGPGTLRSPLVLSLSTNGTEFTRSIILVDKPPPQSSIGKDKAPLGFAYPDTVEWRKRLFITYSINKEDIAITRVEIPVLQKLVGQ